MAAMWKLKLKILGDYAVSLGVIVAFSLLLRGAEYVLMAQTRIAPDQLKAPRVAVMTCTKTPIAPVTNPDGTITPGSDCTGLYYIDVITPAGIELKIVGTIQPQAVNAADWSLVP